MRLRLLVFALAIATVWAAPPPDARAQPAGAPPMDPRRMSGIPRPDPQVEPGTVTVRCLRGSFSEPAIGLEVQLRLTTPDGREVVRTQKTAEQGRATFTGLDSFTGGNAVATVDFGREIQTSRPIPILPQAGSRVMLVMGASPAPTTGAPVAPTEGGGAAPPANPHGQAGAPHGDVPMPGTAFPLRERPPGTLVVGTLNLAAGEPVPGIDVTLQITPPQGEPTERTLTSDEMGRAVFEGLLPPAVPAGSKLVARATIAEEPKISEPFEIGETALAVILAHGRAPEAQAPPLRGPNPLPGPQARAELPASTVRVRVVDGKDEPVADQPVQVVRTDVTGNKTQIPGVTGADGVADVIGVEVRPDSLYFVGVAYDDAPYRSAFFRMDRDRGVAVAVRVFPVTADAARVKSAVQFELRPRENDLVQVVQLYEVLVEGDHAYWPAGGMKLRGADGAHGLVVLQGSERWLEEKDKAPFALVPEPIPPGQVARLSIGYLLDHDGAAQVSWRAPFGLAEASVVLPQDLSLAEPAGLSPQELPQAGDLKMYGLGPQSVGSTVSFAVADLPTRPRVFRWVGLGLTSVLVLIAGLAVATRPRGGMRERLEARKQELFAELDRVVEAGDGTERARILSALDRVYRELEALGSPTKD